MTDDSFASCTAALSQKTPDLSELAQSCELVLRVIPMPADTNADGDIFGGWVMAQVDLAGSVLPLRIAGKRMVTVGVNDFVFKKPIAVGDIVSFYSCITAIGRSSVTVVVRVFAERLGLSSEMRQVTEGTLTYVAVGPDGRPRPMSRVRS